jgi:predicted NAD/FAD-binding protein
MKIAIVGTGIAGNVVAARLRDEHEITVYESARYVGGHTNTVDVEHGGRAYAVDTGFIVFNDWTYPRFVELLRELGVASRPSSMSFGFTCERTGLEYNGSSLGSLFAQRRNLLRPSFYRMLAEILRFNREAPAELARERDTTLADFLAANGYSQQFIDHYLVPMAAAIWSAEPGTIFEMPARFLIRFFANHGMLSVNERPVWRVVEGGSRRYVERLVAPHRERIRLGCRVRAVERSAAGVDISADGAARERFDAVFLACHSDQALALLADASPAEREVLGAIRYTRSEAVLHTDSTLLPRNRRAWGSWNYRVPKDAGSGVAVTYHMNRLQGLDAPVEYCVTLNDGGAVAPERVLARYRYEHPLFDLAAVAAQRRHAEIDGVRGTYFCGAYWRNGFHEDGVVSALTALEHFNDRTRNAQLPLRRTG